MREEGDRRVVRARHLFQLNLDLGGRPCLVVGGDGEALEKTERLIECEADVTLVSPIVLPRLEELARAGRLRWEARRYRPGDEAGRYFVLNCVKTDPALSAELFQRCSAAGILISSYDQPEASLATMAALVRAGSMRLAISSDGESPAVARKLRIELEKLLDDRFARFVEWVAAYRKKMTDEGVPPEERKRRLRDLMAGFEISGTIKYPESF